MEELTQLGFSKKLKIGKRWFLIHKLEDLITSIVECDTLVKKSNKIFKKQKITIIEIKNKNHQI
jgi:hypothetical protein